MLCETSLYEKIFEKHLVVKRMSNLLILLYVFLSTKLQKVASTIVTLYNECITTVWTYDEIIVNICRNLTAFTSLSILEQGQQIQWTTGTELNYAWTRSKMKTLCLLLQCKTLIMSPDISIGVWKRVIYVTCVLETLTKWQTSWSVLTGQSW